jgi:hypothetical protein
VVGGLVVEVLAATVRPGPDRLARQRLFATLAALVTWIALLTTAYLTAPAAAVKPELVFGLPLVQSMLALLLAILLVPSRPAPTVVAGAPF